MRERILGNLGQLEPVVLELIDESRKHKGHIDGNENESHFKLMVVSNKFVGQNIIDRHKLVYSLLEYELAAGGLHALSISALTEEEYNKRKQS